MYLHGEVKASFHSYALLLKQILRVLQSRVVQVRSPLSKHCFTLIIRDAFTAYIDMNVVSTFYKYCSAKRNNVSTETGQFAVQLACGVEQSYW